MRHFVTGYEPGRRVEFQFTGPTGFNGSHSFTATSHSNRSTLLRHELVVSSRGAAVFTWPFFFRPLHNAVIEESFDRALQECGSLPDVAYKRPLWTKMLRATFSARLSRLRRNSR